jgi:hypothetical protein
MKLVLCILATLMVLLFVTHFAGGAWMGSTAFHLPVVGWAMTWAVLLFMGVLALCWKVAKGK